MLDGSRPEFAKLIDSCSKVSADGDATVLSIGDNGMGIFLMVPRVGVLLW